MESRGDCTLTTCPVADGFFSSPPSQGGSAFFLAFFCLLIPVNLITGMRYKTPLYSSAIIAGLAFQAMGYIGRILLHSDPANTSYFALYMMGINIGPTFLTAAIFLILPRIIILYGSEFAIISQPLYLAIFFLAFGTFAVAFEAAGAAFAATGDNPDEMAQGTKILMAGLVIQAVSIVLFYAIYWYFLYRLHHRRHVLDPKYSLVYCSAKFSIFALCIQLATVAFLIRTIIRIVALDGGLYGSVSQSEIVSLMLDGALVLFSCLVLSIIPVGAVFGSTWQQTSPFTTGGGDDDDEDLPLYLQTNQPRIHRRNISPPFPALLPSTYQPRQPPYRPAGPPPRPPQMKPVYNRPPYTSSPPRELLFIHPAASSSPITPARRAHHKLSLVRSDNLW